MSAAADSFRRVAALYVDPRGPYPKLLGPEFCWDEARDARKYTGPWPVVAHPPCARWCRLAKLVESMHGTRVGDDKGCFAAALASVRRYGGILEHPAWSLAWGAHGLLAPLARGWSKDLWDSSQGWVCEVSQAVWGHRAPKATWLYFVGPRPPIITDWSRPKTSMTTATSRRLRGGVEMTSHRERAATPPLFAEWLVSLARSVQR
jgi:hypothetical protein